LVNSFYLLAVEVSSTLAWTYLLSCKQRKSHLAVAPTADQYQPTLSCHLLVLFSTCNNRFITLDKILSIVWLGKIILTRQSAKIFKIA